ncbi:TPA: helix-turn-helix transcriptional regulator [Citrobacter koseri]|uniref:helix-turn-helix domain-containing protein n=1 Tax=Citrobacter koseri TaxID=545 RepID=UPI0023AEB6B9|nr:helix-turn-helix transcriptional regulator [Citrobacter koseri]HBL6925837.1 helix-turn-helix transcriptional regulator [Citrobacter koseri]HBL6930740.1 helix-turn-helix transcriptional regulator [Citrobacter koseri]
MRNNSLYHTEVEMNSEAHKKIYAAEELTFNVTEDILIQMEDREVSKSDLAERLGKTKAYVSQLLSGSRNMTLRTLSDICYALNIKPTVGFEDEGKTSIASKPILSNEACIWQDVVNDFNGFSETLNHGTGTLRKANVVVSTEKGFWRKVA